MEQVEDNLDTFDSLRPLNEEEKAAIAAASELYRTRTVVPCTGCRYCMPCPMGVDIPGIFRIRNNAAIYERRGLRKGGLRADGGEEPPDLLRALQEVRLPVSAAHRDPRPSG